MTTSTHPPKIDIELGHIRDGYPALAAWIARDADHETFVFRKFNRLGARNILHLQNRLIALEKEIDDLDEEARRSDDFETRQSSRRYETLVRHAKDENRPEKKRLEKLDEMQGLLKEYCKRSKEKLLGSMLTRPDEVLLLQAQIAHFKGPSSRVLETLRDYVEGRACKHDDLNAMPIISGRAKNFLSDDADLIALRRAEEEDVLSRFLQDHWPFPKRQAEDPLDRTTMYKNSHVVRTVAGISMVLAAILLIGAIVSLHAVTSDKAKLGLVATFTVLFAASIALLTNARRAEVFAATAAYAAVLVVFVSGDLGASSSEQCLVQLENGIFKTIRCPT
jgi:hypothetical protein